jgi:hypothetical protein
VEAVRGLPPAGTAHLARRRSVAAAAIGTDGPHQETSWRTEGAELAGHVGHCPGTPRSRVVTIHRRYVDLRDRSQKDAPATISQIDAG